MLLFSPEPVSISPDGYVEQYNIGSNICIDVDQSDPSNDRPVQIARLKCADKGRNEEENIPSVLPLPIVTWQHISLDGCTSAFFLQLLMKLMMSRTQLILQRHFLALQLRFLLLVFQLILH